MKTPGVSINTSHNALSHAQDPTTLERVARSTMWLWRGLLITCVSILLWSVIFQLDIVSMAEGVVQPFSKVQRVSHLEGGILRAINVKEGDRVAKGQVLVTMVPTQSRADVGEITVHMSALQADIFRLQAENADAEAIAFPPAFTREHPELAQKASDLLHTHRESLRIALHMQEKEIAAKEQDVAEITARLANTRQRYQLAVEQLQIGERLLAKQLSNRYEQIDREKDVAALKSRIEEDEPALRRSRELAGKARSEIKGLQAKYTGDVRKELADVQRQWQESSSRSEKSVDALARTDVVAPTAGIVKSLYFTNAGAVIPPGANIIDLVPLDDRLIVEVKLPLKEVGYIELGQTAIMQLASSDASHYGRLDGVVEYISPDSVVPTKEGPAFYIVRASLPRDYFGQNNNRYRIIPGVSVTVGIVTGKRSMLEYLLYPLMRTLPFAATER